MKKFLKVCSLILVVVMGVFCFVACDAKVEEKETYLTFNQAKEFLSSEEIVDSLDSFTIDLEATQNGEVVMSIGGTFLKVNDSWMAALNYVHKGEGEGFDGKVYFLNGVMYVDNGTDKYYVEVGEDPLGYISIGDVEVAQCVALYAYAYSSEMSFFVEGYEENYANGTLIKTIETEDNIKMVLTTEGILQIDSTLQQKFAGTIDATYVDNKLNGIKMATSQVIVSNGVEGSKIFNNVTIEKNEKVFIMPEFTNFVAR